MQVSAQTDTSGRQSVLDWIKWVAVAAIVGAGIFGNWYYQDQSLLNRVIALILMAAVASAIAFTTVRGQAFWVLLKEARTEIRRVVWPTRQETTQTTFIVVMLILVFALILWGLDSLLGWIVSSVIG
jgi:preprotein translocase subunit SecE